MRITGAGNVGIDTSSPLAALHVAADAYRQLYLTLSSDPTNRQMRIGYDASNNTAVVEGFYGAGGVSLLLNPSGGNVGIGTTSPIQPLEVIGATYAAPATTGSAQDGSFRVSTSGHGEGLDVGIAGGVVWMQSRNRANYANNYTLSLNPNGGNVGIGIASPGYRVDISGDCNITGTYRVNGAPLATGGYWTASAGGIYYAGGVVGINMSTLSTPYTLNLGPGGNGGGNLYVQGVPYSISYTGFITTSDVTVKANIRPFQDGLDLVRRMRPVQFEYNGAGPTSAAKGATNIGAVAQQLREVAPYMVVETPERIMEGDVERAVLGTNLNAMPWILVNAICEVAARLERLEKLLAEKIN